MASSAYGLHRHERAFRPSEIVLAALGSAGILTAFFALLVLAGKSSAHVQAKEAPPPTAIPIAVKPVLDDLPLLKQGGKKVRPQLPDMWQKPQPLRRVQPKPAPSPKAQKTPEAAPQTPPPKASAEEPKPEDQVAKEVDQVLEETPGAEPVVEGEGAPDGVKEGTETDPLKARAVSQYLAKILAWFNARFQPPVGQIPCDELKALSAGVAVMVGSDRQITGYTITSPSNNPIFDERVKSTLERIVGEQLPPPPPLYPDILESTV